MQPSTPSSVAINPGFAFTGADIAMADSPKVVRHLDAYHTAVFVQSWFGAAVVTRVKHEKPPVTAHVYRVAVTGSWDGPSAMTTRPVFVAIDGVRAWIALAGVALGSLDWWVAPDRVVSAFDGSAQLVPTAGTGSLGATTTTVGRDATQGGGGRTWAVALAVLLLAAAGTFTLVRRARQRTARI